jgi:hypothetical protein
MKMLFACLLIAMLAGCAGQGGAITTYGTVDAGISHETSSRK